MKRWWRALALIFAMTAGAAHAHEITFSHVEIGLDRASTHVRTALPIKALLHEEPSPLPAGTTDASLRARSLARDQAGALARLTTTRLHITANGRPLPLTVEQVEPAGDDVVITATAPRAVGALAVDANLFPADGLAKVFVNVSRGGELVGQYALDRADPRFTLDAPAQPVSEVVATFVAEGVRHIFIGPDHILFVLALVLLGGSVWSQAKIVTAFTLAHSLTLALAALGIVHVPSRLVESLIALSIVVVGAHDLWRLRRGDAEGGRDPRVIFAFGFGLVHGFGFASVLGELALPAHALAWALAAFNIGVEIGQVAIVLAAAPLLWSLRRHAPPRLAHAVLVGAAVVVIGAGGWWFAERALAL